MLSLFLRAPVWALGFGLPLVLLSACVWFESDRAGNCHANKGTWHSTGSNEGWCSYPNDDREPSAVAVEEEASDVDAALDAGHDAGFPDADALPDADAGG